MDLNDFIKVELIQDDEKDDISIDKESTDDPVDNTDTRMTHNLSKLESMQDDCQLDEYTDILTDPESISSDKSSSDFKPPSSPNTDPLESDEERRVIPLKITRKKRMCKKVSRKSKAANIKTNKPSKAKRSIVLCGCCSEEFTAMKTYKNHFSENHSTDTLCFKCPICSKKFEEQRCLQNHRRSCSTKHAIEKCSKCDKIFGSSSHLKKHFARIHSDEKRYQCADCFKAFRTKADLKAHSVVHIPVEMRKIYTCDQCARSFTLRRNFLTHLKVHNDPQIFICELCGHTFKTKGNLKSHQVHHTGEKKHSCPLCDKSFASKAYLKVHILLHSNIKLHKCELCGKDFGRRSILTKHLYVHNGTRPYTCQFCQKTFRAKDKLVVHERIHTGEKPYKCQFCPVAFCESGNLQKHKRNVHKDRLNEMAPTARRAVSPKNDLVNPSYSYINDNRTEYSAGNAEYYGTLEKNIDHIPKNSFNPVATDSDVSPALNAFCAEISHQPFMALQ